MSLKRKQWEGCHVGTWKRRPVKENPGDFFKVSTFGFWDLWENPKIDHVQRHSDK